jgi:hypothetical protein
VGAASPFLGLASVRLKPLLTMSSQVWPLIVQLPFGANQVYASLLHGLRLGQGRDGVGGVQGGRHRVVGVLTPGNRLIF